MNNLITDFDQIIKFAQDYQLPLNKKRAILREYLQVKILDILYRQKSSSQLIFVGGTCLRLTRNLDRFSEDLDFDLGEISFKQADYLIERTFDQLKKENIVLDFYRNQTKKRIYWEFRFKNLLFELKIGRDLREKLTIKFDFEKIWRKHQKQTILLNRYGFLVNIVTTPLNQLLVQKLTAYLGRSQTQPRDIYDIVWLISQGAKVDKQFVKDNKLSLNLVSRAVKKFNREEKKLKQFKRRLQPFLVNEKYLDKLNLFPQLLEQLG